MVLLCSFHQQLRLNLTIDTIEHIVSQWMFTQKLINCHYHVYAYFMTILLIFSTSCLLMIAIYCSWPVSIKNVLRENILSGSWLIALKWDLHSEVAQVHPCILIFLLIYIHFKCIHLRNCTQILHSEYLQRVIIPKLLRNSLQNQFR